MTISHCIYGLYAVICSESKERVEEKVESWIYALERKGMKVKRRKTEYMYVNERHSENARRRGRESGGFQIAGLNCTK